MMRLRPEAWIAAAVIAVTMSCGGDGEEVTSPQGTPTPTPSADPGFVNVSLATPNSNDGAIMFTLAGGVMDSLTSAGGTLFSASTGTSQFRAIVAGTITNGTVLRFWMPDRRNIASYTVALEQAAARSTYEQQDLNGYTLSIVP